MNRRRYLWAAIAGAGVVAEVVSLRRHDGATLSETARAVFGTHKPVGKVAFITSWLALSVVVVPHICRFVELVDDTHDITFGGDDQ
jgi:hypothetical protein